MKSFGRCKCGEITFTIAVDVDPIDLKPRSCDCDYCKSNPSSIISHPTMVIELSVYISQLNIAQNGDALANFYRCAQCNSLICVGCELDGKMRGAVNADLLSNRTELGTIVYISPKLLSPKEKIKRWKELWGSIHESVT